jgi:hypothetical protein
VDHGCSSARRDRSSFAALCTQERLLTMSEELKKAKLSVRQASSALRVAALASRGLLSASVVSTEDARASIQDLKDKHRAAVERRDALMGKAR